MLKKLDQLKQLLATGSDDTDFAKGVEIVTEEVKKHIKKYTCDGLNIHQAIDSTIIDVTVNTLVNLINE